MFLFRDRFERQTRIEQTVDAMDVRLDEGFLLRFDVVEDRPRIQKGKLSHL